MSSGAAESPCADVDGEVGEECRDWLIEECRNLSADACEEHPIYGSIEQTAVIGCALAGLLTEPTGCEMPQEPHRCVAGIDYGDNGPLPGWDGVEVLLFLGGEPDDHFTPGRLLNGSLCGDPSAPPACGCNEDW